MKKFILRRKLRIFIEPLLTSFSKLFIRLFKLIFTKRTILFVTNQKIRSVTLGPFSQAFCYIFIAWIANLFIQSLNYDVIINSKSEEINKLKVANSYFADEFEIVNEKLKKVNKYIITITGQTQNVNAKPEQFVAPKGLDEENLIKKDKQTLNAIRNSHFHLNLFTETSSQRIKTIEKAILKTGLNIKKPSIDIEKIRNQKIAEYSLNDKAQITNLPKGGPEQDFDAELERALSEKKLSDPEFIERKIEQAKFNNEVEYLIVLEKLTKALPLSQPMKNYYISSGFGSRIDPITNRLTPHRGLDFVGSPREKVISPSPGKVILARWFSDYGNAIVIDHGYGVTTRYGHLSKIKVVEGERIKEGKVIGLQGSTGRSTGNHLHYEVRYRNVPLNPKRFLEAGELLINNDNGIKHVDI
jgi:murein DD-endopeptidase MepM/ murein hydrolase activator NlpD